MNVRPLLKKRETPRLMGATLRKRPCLRVCFGLLGAAMLCVTATAAQQPHETVDPASGNLVGTAGCAACHKDVVKDFANNPHSRPAQILDGKGVTCESCHGLGKAHAENGDVSLIFAPESATAKAVNEKCQACHGNQHTDFQRSAHGKGNMSCISCHRIHSPGAPRHLLKMAEPQLCFQCHGDVKPQFSMPFHHKVNEGLIDCTDCHEPHGASGENTLRSSTWQFAVCTKCHTATAGPFLYEHAVVKTEGCNACHLPHGSPNPQLLTESNVNTICLHCHFPTPNSIAGRPAVPEHILSPKQPSCTGCHFNIHGSNTSDVFLSSKLGRGKR